MKPRELKEKIASGALSDCLGIYKSQKKATDRIIFALDEFSRIYGEQRDISVFSVPGRSEICGNHTDHNGGCVIAAAVDRDILVIAAKREDETVSFSSPGYPERPIKISDTEKPENFEKYTSEALVAGVVRGFINEGFEVGGFDAYAVSDVPVGSGLSSSAAYEVAVGTALNHLFSDGRIENAKIAAVAKYSENVFFGKPSGLMDQTASAVGGFVYMDFENPDAPEIEKIDYSLSDAGYSLAIINTVSSHSNLNDEYAKIPAEMRSVAKLLGRDTLRGLCEDDIMKNLGNIRRVAGDRAVLRSLHFMRENERVKDLRSALKENDTASLISIMRESGKSSFQLLENLFIPELPTEQPLPFAIAVAEGFGYRGDFAVRVHGGGFAGTVQVVLRTDDTEEFMSYINSALGDGSVEIYGIRKEGAIKLF